MYDAVKALVHSSIRLTGEKTIYFDPFRMKDTPHDADMICVTHEHFDHYSLEDIAKVKKPSTILICPQSMADQTQDCGFSTDHIMLIEPGETLIVDGVQVEAVPAYNIGKPFHPQNNRWVGYIVTMDGVRYYVSGDTDINDDVKRVQCDVALLPVGGVYTMTASEAAELAATLSPKLAIPTHYSAIVGDTACGDTFQKLLEGKVPVRLDLV